MIVLQSAEAINDVMDKMSANTSDRPANTFTDIITQGYNSFQYVQSILLWVWGY